MLVLQSSNRDLHAVAQTLATCEHEGRGVAVVHGPRRTGKSVLARSLCYYTTQEPLFPGLAVHIPQSLRPTLNELTQWEHAAQDGAAHWIVMDDTLGDCVFEWWPPALNVICINTYKMECPDTTVEIQLDTVMVGHQYMSTMGITECFNGAEQTWAGPAPTEGSLCEVVPSYNAYLRMITARGHVKPAR